MSLHVIEIFLFEAMFLGLVGGVIGAVGGLLGTYVWAFFTYNWKLIRGALTVGAILTQLGEGVGLAVVLSVISAIYPVYFAARLEPADAMRYEV
jgi:ABC-type antimicrobial peptide transport system permease subunit